MTVRHETATCSFSPCSVRMATPAWLPNGAIHEPLNGEPSEDLGTVSFTISSGAYILTLAGD